MPWILSIWHNSILFFLFHIDSFFLILCGTSNILSCLICPTFVLFCISFFILFPPTYYYLISKYIQDFYIFVYIYLKPLYLISALTRGKYILAAHVNRGSNSRRLCHCLRFFPVSTFHSISPSPSTSLSMSSSCCLSLSRPNGANCALIVGPHTMRYAQITKKLLISRVWSKVKLCRRRLRWRRVATIASFQFDMFCLKSFYLFLPHFPTKLFLSFASN